MYELWKYELSGMRRATMPHAFPNRGENPLKPLVGHMVQIAGIQIGHHNAVGAIVANVRGIDPNNLVVIQPHQERFDIAVVPMGSVDHGADTVDADQFDAFADEIGIALRDHPFLIAIRPDTTMIGCALRREARAQALIGSGAVAILFLLLVILLELAAVLLLLALIGLLLLLRFCGIGVGLCVG